MAKKTQTQRKRVESIKSYLREFRIESKWSTINGAAQMALAIPDSFDQQKITVLMSLIEQTMDADLVCVYCGNHAATWDHLFNNVQGNRYSGYGNRIFNLVPACRTCNERKGGKHWRTFVTELNPEKLDDVVRRLEAVEKKNDAERYDWSIIEERHSELAAKYDAALRELKMKVRELDALASKIRAAIRTEIDSRTTAALSAKKQPA